MAETSFASLSPSLLARKGGAKPAMRPQHAALASMPQGEPLEDLGWNDMGDHAADETPVPTADPVADIVVRKAAATSAEIVALNPASRATEQPGDAPAPPAVHAQRAKLAQRVAAPRRAEARTGRAAFTLRLDTDRHLKLRLACTMRDCSAQALVTEALDELLAGMPELDTLAAHVKRR
jgi:hypothetical protein